MKDILTELVAPVVEKMGLELYDLEFVKEGGFRILRLFIDKEGGVSLGDCEAASRAVEKALDEKDPIPSAYRLQVGSPGVERALTKPAHFARYMGRRVRVRLFSPHSIGGAQGRKTFAGKLASHDKAQTCFEGEDGGTFCVPSEKISSCRLLVFEDGAEPGPGKNRRKNG